MNIRAEDLVDAVTEELDIYASEVADTVKKTVTAVAKETVKVVKEKSPSASGAYKKSWAQKKTYDNDSISSLKGADRVRKRPGVIFGSDGLEGCEHAVFEILSNAIDEARAGYGRLITVTRFADLSIQVEDQGRGCPVDWNEKEGRYNWELVFCELYAGGKYDNENSDNYEYSLGLNGLGSCATQYASRYMDVTVCRDGKEYRLHFERGEIAGEMRVTELKRRHTGSTIRWLPDLEVFTDIDIPADYYREVLRRQAVVNAGVTFRLRCEVAPGKFETEDFLYEHGIRDYLAELAGDDPLTEPVCWETIAISLSFMSSLATSLIFIGSASMSI